MKKKYLSVEIDLVSLTQSKSKSGQQPTVEGQFRASEFFDCDLESQLHLTTHPLTEEKVQSIVDNIGTYFTDEDPSLREIARILYRWKNEGVDE